MINQDIILSGEKIQQLCSIYCGSDFDLNRNPIISKQKEKHLIIEQLNSKWDNPSLIFCYSCALETFQNKLHFLKNPFVLISHNEDNNITNQYQSILDSPLVIKWFAQNIMINHSKLHILPIGIANSMWQHGNINTLISLVPKSTIKTEDIYFYFNTQTNDIERNLCKNTLIKKGLKFGELKLYNDYLNELSKCKFAICPPGNGIDCHRTWECYYLNVIPILLKSPFTELLSRYLPCILLNSWDDFNYSLYSSYDDLVIQLKNNNFINFNFYKNLIYKYIPQTFSQIDNTKFPLDYKLNSLINKENGIFIELDSNNGLIQSNTAFFEFYKGWKGILIEPSLNNYEECLKNRPNSTCYNLTCVSNDLEDTIGNILDTSLFKSIDLLSIKSKRCKINILKGINLDKYRPKYILIEIYNSEFSDICEYLESYNYLMMCNFSNYNEKDNYYLFFDAM